tara:strand:- start:1333 stop:2373 length:1041 start_codon:yes stop_codon:yes gene_type:complete
MNLFTADVGQGKVHIYDSKNDKFYGKLPEQDLINLNIPELKKGDSLVVECAHLRESHRFTMAQPFNFDELTKLKENAKERGITLLLFPQKSTPKTRKLAGLDEDDKTDEADTKAIANFLLKDRSAFYALKEFTPTRLTDFQEKNNFIFDYIQQCNEDINPAKTSGYGFDKKKHPDYEDAVSRWIKKYALKLTEYLNGDMELIEAIGLKFDRKNNIKIAVPNRIYTLVHSILRPDGTLRVRPDIGLVPNWKYIKAHYLGCKPFHMNQGVAASNYKHWMRRAVSEYAYPDKLRDKNDPLRIATNCTDFQVGMSYEELAKLKKARTKVDKMTQKIWYALRKMIVEDGLR